MLKPVAHARIALAAASDAADGVSVPFLVTDDNRALPAADLLQGERLDIAGHTETLSTGPLGDALRAWRELKDDLRSRASFSQGPNSGGSAQRWRKPIDDHAKVLVIGGHRNGSPARLETSRPPALLKFPTSFAQPDDVLVLRQSSGRFEIDVALGFVIGNTGTRMSLNEATDAIAGYVLLADVTNADVREEEARTNNGLLAKNFRALSPVSPFVLLRVGSPLPSFDIWLNVNGVQRQAISTADLLWSPGEAIAAWSLSTLIPGDIIALGAAASRVHVPAASIVAGDEIEIGCDQLGTSRHTVGTSPDVRRT